MLYFLRRPIFARFDASSASFAIVFMLRMVPAFAAGMRSLDLPIPLRVVHEDLALAEPHLLVVDVDRVLQRIGRRRLVKEDRDRLARRRLRERIGLEHGGHLGGGAHDHADRRAGIGVQALLERGLHLRLGGLAFEHNIAAGDVGLHLREAGVLAHRFQIGHRQLAGAADIDRAQQCDVFGHVIRINAAPPPAPAGCQQLGRALHCQALVIEAQAIESAELLAGAGAAGAAVIALRHDDAVAGMRAGDRRIDHQQAPVAGADAAHHPRQEVLSSP